uniref:Uncharacterized protein n=1 Tax=Triticum urartu TaxID=4572 RepID=A0A8R7NZF0_TRIUA
MRRWHRWDAEQVEGRVPEILQSRLPAGDQRRELGQGRQAGGAGGEECVHRDAGRGDDVNGVDAEHVNDRGVEALTGYGAEEGSERLVAPSQEVEQDQ